MTKQTHLQDLSENKKNYESFLTKQKHTWCSGCGNFGILGAVTRALTIKEIKPHEVLICYDVGCSGNESDKMETYTVHGLHGRVLPLAAGAKIANYDMPIIAHAGDGATFSEGVNHLIHAIRSNYNITFILHNNQNYGLTTGQASSTTPKGQKMNGSSDGKVEDELYTMDLVMGLNPSYVARSFSGDVNHMTETIMEAMDHPGFSYVEILQACPTYNKATPLNWYMEKIFDVKNIPDYDNQDLWAAKRIVDLDKEGKFAIGKLYQKPNSVPFYERIHQRKNIQTNLVDEVKHFEITKLLAEFR